MKLLLFVAALVAVAHGAPTTQTMDIGANGVSGSLSIPLVEIIVNMIKDSETAVPEIANEPVHEANPVIVVDEAQNPEPVNVVDEAVIPEPVIVVEQPVEVITAPGVNPIDVISINPVAPEPEPIVLPEPTPAEVVPAPAPAPVEVNPIDVISVNPVAPEPGVVPAPIVLPEPTPAEVVPAPAPAPVDVIDVPSVINPEPVQVVEAPAVAVEAGEAGASQIINVMMNFIFGESGALSSVEVPAHVIPQIVASAPRV